MLEPIVGIHQQRTRVDVSLCRKEGYAREIARLFATDLAPIQKQLAKLEAGGVLVSRSAGRTRLFSFNPRYPMVDELRALLEKTLQFYPPDLRERLLMNRRRPRRTGKPS